MFFRTLIKIMPIKKTIISKIRKALISAGNPAWDPSNISKNLPRAIEPTRNTRIFIAKSPTCLLKMPIRNITPMTILMPPYIPANSEYPIGDITDKPTAS